jgi:hypothetical protein
MKGVNARDTFLSSLFVLLHMLRIKRNDKGTHSLWRPFAVDSDVEFPLSAFGGAFHLLGGGRRVFFR